MTRKHAAGRINQGLQILALATIILSAGITLCSLTVTVFTAIPGAEERRFVTEGGIICGIGAVLWMRGAAIYLKAALETGYTNDSI